jgi:hypothetical protein
MPQRLKAQYRTTEDDDVQVMRWNAWRNLIARPSAAARRRDRWTLVARSATAPAKAIVSATRLSRVALLTLCFASAAAPGANAGGSDDVPWQDIATLATDFVAQESASGVFPFVDHSSAKSASRKVFLNYFPWLLLSLDNKPLNADFWSSPGKIIPAVPASSDTPGAFFDTKPITLNQRPISPQPWDSPFWRERNLTIDIFRAQRIGADGFLLTLPQINQGPMWDAAVMLCGVASHVAPGFRVIIQPGMASLAGGKVEPAALVEAIATLGGCPAAYHLADGRLVIAPWAAEKEPPEFWRTVISGLAAKGIKTALLPVLLSASEDSAGKLAPLSYEMSYWAWADVNSTAGPAHHARELLSSYSNRWMAPVRPQDVRPKQSISGESENTTLFRQMWMAAIEDPKAADVQVITWNDLSEGTEIEPASATQFLFYDLAAYYTSWYKTGHPPAIRSDAIYYCSRTQVLAATAADAPATERYRGIPVAASVGPMKVLGQTPLSNNVEMVAFLTAPSRLEIVVGGRTFQKDAAGPGLALLTVPAVAGRPKFRIMRAGAGVAQVEAHYAIAPAGAVPNLFYYGGSSNRPVVEMPISPRPH